MADVHDIEEVSMDMEERIKTAKSAAVRFVEQ